MQKILVTGAAGDVGSRLRKLLKGIYPSIRWSDIRTPDDLAADEEFIAADLSQMAEVEKIVEGVEGIVHLGGFSVEGPWDTILQSNIVGTYNMFEAAYRANVKRVVFASSNHAVGFYPRDKRIGINMPVRPDSRYGVSKAFGEAIGAFYADKHGLRVTCLRIGNVGAGWRSGLSRRIWCNSSASGWSTATSSSRFSTAPPTMLPAGGTIAMPSATAITRTARATISATRPWPRRPNCRRTRSPGSSRAGRFAAPNTTPNPEAICPDRRWSNRHKWPT
jgi:hypothetical protein